MRGGLDMRDCASQGEQRTALLALVLAEWEQLLAGPRRPLLLLDDVMSELDISRRRRLVALHPPGRTDPHHHHRPALLLCRKSSSRRGWWTWGRRRPSATGESRTQWVTWIGWAICCRRERSGRAAKAAGRRRARRRAACRAGRRLRRRPGPAGGDRLGRRVGPEVAANARPVQLRDGRLVVTTSSSAWAQTLQLMSPMVVERLERPARARGRWRRRCSGMPDGTRLDAAPGQAAGAAGAGARRGGRRPPRASTPRRRGGRRPVPPASATSEPEDLSRRGAAGPGRGRAAALAARGEAHHRAGHDRRLRPRQAGFWPLIAYFYGPGERPMW